MLAQSQQSQQAALTIPQKQLLSVNSKELSPQRLQSYSQYDVKT